MKKLIFVLVIFSSIIISCSEPLKQGQSLKLQDPDPGFALINRDTAALMIKYFTDSPSLVNHRTKASIQGINLLRADMQSLISDTNTAEVNFFMAAYLPADSAMDFDFGSGSRANQQTVIIELKRYINGKADSVYEYRDARNPTTIVKSERSTTPICPPPPCRKPPPPN